MTAMGDSHKDKGAKVDFDKLRKFTRFNSEAVDEQSPLLVTPSTDPPPTDTFRLTYLLFCLHGIGHLLPWNFFITANEYFSTKFGCTDANGHMNVTTSTHCDFENFFSVCSMLPILVMTGINIWLQSRIHYTYRMLFSLSIMLVLFILTTALVPVHTERWLNGFYALTLITVTIMSMFSAIFQSSTFGFAGLFPPKYTSAVMTGQACAGIFAAVADIVSKLAGKSQTNSAIGYFSTAVVVIILCILSFFVLLRLKFVKYYLSKTSVTAVKNKQEAAVKHSVNENIKSEPFYIVSLRVFREIFFYALSVFLVFSVTLSVFPAVISSIRSSSPNREASGWTSKYFTPLVCFLLFNLSDFAGRYVTHWFMIGSHRYILLAAAILRVGFIPLFLFCNAFPNGSRSLPVPFLSDAWPVLFTLLLGISNGYMGTVAMIRGPAQVPEDRQETAGTMMAFFLSGGLLAGGSFSFLWTYVIRS